MRLFCFMLIFGLSCFAYEQFTLIGHSEIDVRNQSLLQNTFGTKDKLAGQLQVKACESIDNSMMVVFSDQVPAETLEDWFGNAGVRNSLKELLRRGGVLYFGWNSWTNLNHPLSQTRAFYKSCNIPFPDANKQADFTHPVIKDFPKDAKANGKCDAAFLRTPNDFVSSDGKGDYQMTGIRWWKDWKAPGLETYFATQDGEPMIVGVRNVLGKGVALFPNSFTPMRQKDSKFIVNLVNFAYGARKTLNDKELSAKAISKLKNGQHVEILPVVLLQPSRDKSEKLVFKNHREKKAVKLAAEARVFGDASKITVHFRAMRPGADKIVNKYKKRDETIWYDDAVNIMFAADRPDAPNFSFLINSDAAVYDSKGENPAWNGKFSLTTKRHPEYWEGEFSIAPAELGVDLTKESYLLFNIGRENGTPGPDGKPNEVLSVFPGYNDPTHYAILGLGTVEKLQEAFVLKRQRPVANTPYLIWTDNPYLKKYTTSLPTSADDKGNLKLTVARNEQECAALFLTNLTERNMVFRMEPDFKLKETNIPFQELLELKEVMPRLNLLGQPQFDGISRMNEAGIISVPAFETKMLWLDVKTMLPPGIYKWELECVPTLSRDARKKFHVEIEVLDYEFPKQLRAESFGFGPYLFSFAEGKRDAYFKVWREHHLNMICQGMGIQPKAIQFDKASGKIIISEKPEDYEMDEEWLLEHDFRWFYSYGSYRPFIAELAKYGKKLNIFDAEFRELFGKYLRNWSDSLKKRKIPFDRFFIEVQDEPTPEIYDEYVAAGKFMKKTVPEMTIFGTIPTWIDQAALERFKDFITLWVPWEPRLTERESGKAELEFYKKTSNRFMPYLCAINLPQANMQTYCRFRGMRSFLMGTDWFSQWGFNSWRNNEWFPDNQKDSWNSFMFYHGTNGPIVCPRMEAFREAVEDLHILLEAKEILKNRQDAELTELIAEKTLKAVMQSDDANRILEWRTDMLRRLAKLSKK